MAYDPKLEKIIKEIPVQVDENTSLVGKAYQYNGGKTKCKILTSTTSKGKVFVSNKFPAISNKKYMEKMIKLLVELKAELE
jgi:hypothetical protein